MTRQPTIRNTTPDSAIVGRTRVLIITPMPDSGAPLKMNLRPSATKIRGIQQTSERLIGFLEWGADFILALARDASLLARDDGHAALIAARALQSPPVSQPGGFVWL